MQQQAIGIIETNSWGFVTSGLDTMLKAANVRIVKYDLVGGVWIAVYVAGDINAVRTAIDTALASTMGGNQGVLVRGTVISNPTREFLELFDL